jgi:hypothetical protein
MSGNPALCGLASGLNAYVSGASLGQAVKTGAIAWATVEGFQWAGQQGPAGSAPASRAAATSFERYAAHAAVGCVSSAVGGGQCGSGAASAVFGKFATNTIGGPGVNTDFGEVLAKRVATAVAGGVGSVIAGGKFENGAKTAAYGYLFNQLKSMECSSSARHCTATVGEERLHYTGKMTSVWHSVDWNAPQVNTYDLTNLAPNLASKFPGIELSVSLATQRGELLHEARVDVQNYTVTIVDQIEVSRVPAALEIGTLHRWVPAPGRNDDISRTQWRGCVSVMCAEWRN